MSKKIVSIFELTLIVMSSFAFAYFVSTDLPDVFEKQNSIVQYLAKPLIPVVSASDYVPSGCCKETVSGATCQDVLLVDKALCKTDLIGTSCNVVSECQKGCCYDADSGICSLNAPKESCTTFGGIWDKSATCSIQQCQVGCCILGDGAVMTTTRECTKLSNEYEVNKIFKPLDSRGSCDAYADLRDEGACLTESNDYSGLKNCVFTTKGNCNRANQIFKKDYLCTSKELNTTCLKTTKTTCSDDKVYFIDSCGNKANVYDSFKGKNQTYWEKIISPKDSCSGVAEFCGNCDYTAGSICTKYFSGQNLIKPEMGDYVCKNLDCIGGRKHGESWCISDADNSKDLSQSVGTRNYVATCFEGEIKLEGCADFNQEVCIENANTAKGKSEAMCVVNDWRSCIYANDAASYSAVKTRCDALPQCIMFNEISGNEKYSDLPGFKEDLNNKDQGKAGEVGKDMNEIITHCVPRFTPGYQFWSSNSFSNPFSSSGKVESTASYGGSESETNSLCNLGTFTCVSHIKTVSSIAGGSSSTDMENPECNWQAEDQSKQKVTLMMDALNDRCRSLGSCGLQYNTQGELGRSGFDVNRVYINKKGKSTSGYTTEGYNVTNSYLSELKREQEGNKFGTTEKIEDLTNWKSGASLLTQFGSEFSSSNSMIAGAFADSVSASDASNVGTSVVVGAVGTLAGMGASAGFGSIAAEGAIASGTVLAEGSTVAAGTQLAGGSSIITSTGTGMSTAGTYTVTGGTATVGPGGATVTGTGGTAGGGGATTATGATVSGALTVVAIAAIAFVVGSYIGQTMSKGMPPGEAKVNTALWAGGTTAAVTTGVIIYSLLAKGSPLCAAGGPITWILCAVIAIAAIIYAVFTKGVDHEYYVTEFKCEAWQPPLVGKCEECNNDVRSCTEFKCRSIGNNCHYFVENGEPGYCATLDDVWSATIEPWKEIITSGNDYSNISSFGFRIENRKNEGKGVNAWEPVTFGIVTDKEAVCRIDINHSLGFESMRYQMASEVDYSTGKIDGRHHKIVLSPHATLGEFNEDMKTTIPMEEGENEYFIICQNYAGLTNDAPFVVQVKQTEGPDLTPPLITKYSPDNNAYLANNATGLNLYIYLNEPSECRYSFESYNMNWGSQNNSDVISMTQETETPEIIITAYENTKVQTTNENSFAFSCITGANMGFYGEWMCAAFLENYTSDKKIYIECKDQPDLIEVGPLKRNVVRKEYSAQVCQTGLYITSVEPQGKVEKNANDPVTLSVKTEGCINGGDASCSFRLPYYGDTYSLMLTTGNKTHIQPFTSLGEGTRDVDVMCEDSAGNIATTHTNFTVFIDDNAPEITRAYIDSDRLVINTDEDSECLFVTNESLGCDFGFEKATNKYGTAHTLPIDEKSKKKYFIKCKDTKGNGPLSGCTIELKLSDMQQ